jgi:acyl-CoA thioesterase II
MSSLDEDLQLEQSSDGRYHRAVSERWTFADRVFGGYTASMAAAAARLESPHASLLATHVTFLEAARIGPIDLTVTPLRRGRATWAGRILAEQGGRPILACDTWFGDRPAGAAMPPSGGGAVPGPESYPSLAWLQQLYTFLDVFDETAVDYPADEHEEAGPARVEVWARPKVPVGEDPFLGQVLELMLADAHLLDAAMRPQSLAAGLAVSLDLAVWWERPSPNAGWLRLVVEAAGWDEMFASCRGTIHAEDGTLRASAGQQGRFLSP